jgi:hypothetical protein
VANYRNTPSACMQIIERMASPAVFEPPLAEPQPRVFVPTPARQRSSAGGNLPLAIVVQREVEKSVCRREGKRASETRCAASQHQG